MASPQASPGLEALVAAHRIWFEVHRETDVLRARRVTVALQVFLWGTVPKRQGALPESPGCRAVHAALRAAAQAAIAGSGALPVPDVEPFHWALYASRQVPGADEVRVEVNLRAAPGDEAAQAGRERNLVRLRRALDALGVYEGGWRRRTPLPAPAPRPVEAGEPERWAVRPAAAALGGAAAAWAGG